MTRLCALGFLLLVLSGCSAPPKDRYYVLGAAEGSNSASALTKYTVAISAVSVPDLVNRNNIVVYQPDNRVEIMEHERWAEPLSFAIPSAIAAELRSELPDARIAVYPQRAAADADCFINLDIQRFEARRGSSALVEALWSVRCAKGPVQRGRSLVLEKLQADSYSTVVAGYDRALVQIGKELAQAVRTAR